MVSQSDLKLFLQWLRSPQISEDGGFGRMLENLAERSITLVDHPVSHRRYSKYDLIDDVSGSEEERQERARRRPTRGLVKFLEQRRERYREFLRQNDCTTEIVVRVLDGGGRGKQSLFWVEAVPLEGVLESDPASGGLGSPSDAPLVYWHETPSSEIRLSWSGRLAFGPDKNISPSTLRGRIFLWKPLVGVSVAMLLGAALVLQFWLDTAPLTARHIGILLLTIVLGVAAWTLIWRPLFNMFSGPTVLLDDAYLAIGEPPVVLEVSRTGKGKAFRVARYEADCPVCFARLHVAAGEPEWPGRLVGRCNASPHEHVYSFDRVTLVGEALRVPRRQWQQPPREFTGRPSEG